MANNRLYIVERSTGDRLLLASSMGDGWQLIPTSEEMQAWLIERDSEPAPGHSTAALGDCNDRTGLFIEAQNDDCGLSEKKGTPDGWFRGENGVPEKPAEEVTPR